MPYLYPVPSFLSKIFSVASYNHWLDVKAQTLYIRDKKHGKPCARGSSKALYKSLVHYAVTDNGAFDPFTGEKLDWTLTGTYDLVVSHERKDAYKKELYLMPTVDHCDPDRLEFDILSWLVNSCKSDLRPAEFIALCRRVVDHCSKSGTQGP
jgi:hypothetical protein